MTREYILQGLDCANCATAIEKAVNKLQDAKSASLNIVTTSLKVETDDISDELNRSIEEIVHLYEPDVTVFEKGVDNSQRFDEHDSQRAAILRLILGAAALGIGILLQRLITNEYIPFAIFLAGYLIVGGRIIIRAAKNISRGRVFDENFLMSIATIGALALGEYAEAVVVMLFYGVGEYFQDRAVGKSKKSIAKLMDLRPDFANLKRGGDLLKVNPETVRIGDTIIVKPGEKIPLDGVVTSGSSMLDTSALTGESVPRKAAVSDVVLSGSLNVSGLLEIEVTKLFGESTASKIIDLVENAAHKKAPTEQFITKFARYYTPVVVILAILLAVIPPLIFGGIWSDWLRRGLIFLVISCPCALVISIPLGYFGGIGGSSKRGVLFKGSNYLEAMSNLDIAVFDKTGTLTKGVFKVAAILPAKGFSSDELLELAATAESFSNHPIAQSILREYGKSIDSTLLFDYEEIAGLGVSVNFNGRTIFAGSKKLMDKVGICVGEFDSLGTHVYVAADNAYVGIIVISDELKSDSHDAITGLKAKGVRKTIMLTGDIPSIANAVADVLGIDEVHAELLPNQKIDMIEQIRKSKRPKGTLAFVGDGINDAPVLAMADIGVAMGGLGSDAAIEAADVVLMTDEPSKLVEAVTIARFTKRIVWQNIVFALGVKGIFLILGALGVSSMWEAIFADVGVSILAIFNAMRVMRS